MLHGLKNWKKISSELKTHLGIIRTTKQCRDRWINYLKKGLNNKDISASERSKLLKLFENYGASWNKISKFLPGHSENQLKNFINATIRRNIRRYNKIKPKSEKISINSIKLLDCPEIKEILLADKSMNNIEFHSICLSSKALEFIQLIESEELKGKMENNEKLKDLQIVDELDKILDILTEKYENTFEMEK